MNLEASSGIINGAAYFKRSPSELGVPSLKGRRWGSKFSVSLWFKRIASYTGIQGLISNGGIDHNGVNNRSEIIGKYNFITISLQQFGENLLERGQKREGGFIKFNQNAYITLCYWDHPSSIYKKPRCDFRSALMKTLDWSVETLGRECNTTGICIHSEVPMQRKFVKRFLDGIAKIT